MIDDCYQRGGDVAFFIEACVLEERVDFMRIHSLLEHTGIVDNLRYQTVAYAFAILLKSRKNKPVGDRYIYDTTMMMNEPHLESAAPPSTYIK